MMIRGAREPGSAERCAIAVMAKASSPGRTKTRLVPPLTLEQAAELNTVFLQDLAGNVAQAARRAPLACYMAFGPPQAADFFKGALGDEVGLFAAWQPQFGDCLQYAISVLLDAGYGAACVLNSDSPTLPEGVLVEAAMALLQPGDRIVVGPSIDGGYYLLGMKRAHKRLFEDIDWSTSRVFGQTMERAAELGLQTVLLPEWYDVDDERSLRLLAREILSGVGFSPALASFAAPRTRATLRRMLREGNLAPLL